MVPGAALVALVKGGDKAALDAARAGLDVLLRPEESPIAAGVCLRSAAIAYDWAWPYLTDVERRNYAELLWARSMDIVEHQERVWDYHNLLAVVHGELVFPAGALLGDTERDPDARELLRSVETLYKANLLPAYDQVAGASGGWHEGVSYASYAASRLGPQLEAWDDLTGEDLLAQAVVLRQGPRFLEHVTRPDGRLESLGDSNQSWDFEEGPEEGWRYLPLCVAEYRDPVAVRRLARIGEVPAAEAWKALLRPNPGVPAATRRRRVLHPTARRSRRAPPRLSKHPLSLAGGSSRSLRIEKSSSSRR